MTDETNSTENKYLIGIEPAWCYVGADPEIILTDLVGIAVPAEDLLGVGKAKKNISIITTRYADEKSFKIGSIHRDGFQVEFNIEPATCRAYALDNIWGILSNLYKMVEKKGYNFCKESSITVPHRILERISKDSKTFGCEPDYNAHTSKANIVTLDGSTHTGRYAGGHIHVGPNTDLHREVTIESWHKDADRFVQIFDAIVGQFCVLLDRRGGYRRKHYGQAGAYRKQPHGIEYRVPSNFWIFHPGIAHIIFGLSQFCAFLQDRNIYDALFSVVNKEDIVNAINEDNLVLAKKNWDKLEPIFTQYGDNNRYRKDRPASGINSYFWNPFKYLVWKGLDKICGWDIKKNWNLNSYFMGHGITAQSSDYLYNSIINSRSYKEWDGDWYA